MRLRRGMSAAAAAFLVLFSLPGWCPPPPNFGVFAPNGQTYTIGPVPVGSSQSVTLTFVVAPAFASTAPYGIAANFSAYLGVSAEGFSIDANGATCVAGAIVTPTTGCTVKVTFAPTSVGQRGAIIDVAAVQVSDPTTVATVAFDNLVGIAVLPTPAPTPTLHVSVLIILSVLMALLAAALLRRRTR